MKRPIPILKQLPTYSILKTTLIAIIIFSTPIIFSQSCSTGPGTLPFKDQTNKCKTSTSSNYPDTWEDRINAYNTAHSGQAGWKLKYRSVFVNQSVNTEGGFAQPWNNSGVFYFDPNKVGSVFGVDGDNDGVYEREDALLIELQNNDFDEIVLYNISNILQNGDKIAKDYNPVNVPLIPFDNIMLEEMPMDWHLARFIYKAKTQYNFEVVAVVPKSLSNTDYSDRFYNFYDNYVRVNWYEDYQEVIENFNSAFIDLYQEAWLYNPEDLHYLEYGEDTLFLPKDSEGRISHLDKAITDIYNVNLFEYRVKTGLINYEGETISPIGTGANTCDNGFDAHLFEWEWWDTPNPDQELTALKGLVEFSSGLQTIADICYPKHYIAQNHFDDPSWPNTQTSEEDRANLVDSMAHRVYLYDYNKNPCDCYWGRGNNPTSGDLKDFNHRVSMLANNGFGADNGTAETFVLPVFLAKYHDINIIEDSLNIPTVYGDNNKGCNNDLTACDYCSSKSGTALNDLANHGLQKRLGYVENIFQEQYNFDASNTSASNSDNHIFGYSWFKSRILLDNDFISSTNNIEKGNYFSKVYQPIIKLF
tara:strand:+ start:341 stop:2107 length:1767 start_codon:yes stop_codon:yes gene_type:complete